MVVKKKGAISAGPGLTPTDQVDFQLAFRNDWLEKYGGVNQLVALEVEGDSMAPELKGNDVVLINKNIKEVSLGGGIYAIKWKGNILVKRLQVNPQTGTVLIKSDNPSYETLETNLDDIEIEGKIIWFGREIR
jgi:phage repressor protein C with HTH and peptisase S24 domain